MYKTPFPGNAVTVPEFSAGEDLFLSQIQNQKQQSISVNQQITGGFYNVAKIIGTGLLVYLAGFLKDEYADIIFAAFSPHRR